MSSTESPAVARRRLRLALRRAREARHLTMSEVADALEWSLSKMNRIESGDVKISKTDLIALMTLLDITDKDTIEQLMADARASRQRGWWDEPHYREHLTSAMMHLLQFEGEATAIRSFQPMLVPGLLQIRAYAEAVLGFWTHNLSEDQRAARLEARLGRWSHVFGRPDPPMLLAIVDEAVVRRSTGSGEIMRQQLESLAQAAALPHVLIRILPFSEGIPTVGSFTILDLGDEENAILYRESTLQDEIVHSFESISRHRQLFEQMWDRSLDEAASAELITAQEKAMRDSLATMPSAES